MVTNKFLKQHRSASTMTDETAQLPFDQCTHFGLCLRPVDAEIRRAVVT